MPRTSQHPKDETFNFRVEPALKAAFTAATEADGKSAAQVLLDFMRAYVKQKGGRPFAAEAHRQSLAIAAHSRDPGSDDRASFRELEAFVDEMLSSTSGRYKTWRLSDDRSKPRPALVVQADVFAVLP